MEEHQFCCGECLKPFTCPFLIPIHFQLEHEIRCVCDQSFSERSKLLTHMEDDGCRFPFSIEFSEPAATQHSAADWKPKLTEAENSIPLGALDAVNMCIQKTDSGFSCGICKKVFTQRFYVWQHIKQSHSAVMKKVTSWHLKTIVQKFSAVVGEALACTLCGKPYVKQFNFYEHVCVEHKREVSQITVDPVKIEEDTEENSDLAVLRNRFYKKHKSGLHQCLICRSCRPSLTAITKHLRKHGMRLKQHLDKIIKDATSSQRKNLQSPSKDFSCKYSMENVQLKTENDDYSEPNQKPFASVRSEAVVKRPESELQFLQGYIAKKDSGYYCQLCPVKSARKGYLYQHLCVRHDDILGETLSAFRENETKLSERGPISVRSPTVQPAAGSLTHSIGNVVGNVEFHTGVLPSENTRYKTRSMLFSKCSDKKPVVSRSFGKHQSTVADYGLVKVENVEELPATFAHNFSSIEPPNFNAGELSAIFETPLKRRLSLQPVSCDAFLASDEHTLERRLSSPLRKKLPPLKSPEFCRKETKNVSEVARAFCAKTGTYVCSICKHTLISKSGWYKHRKQCLAGKGSGRHKHSSLSSEHSTSQDRVQLLESAVGQSDSYLSVAPEASKVKRKEGYEQNMWRCVACQCQFSSYSGWQRHFSYCKHKHFTIGKRLRGSKVDVEFLRKNCCRKGRKFSCRFCGLEYARIQDVFYHLRVKHSMAGMASGDDTDVKLGSVDSQSVSNRSPAKMKSELKSSATKKPGLRSGLKRTVEEADLRRRAYVRSQILEGNEQFFCKICGQGFLVKSSARKHINRLHLGQQGAKQHPTTGNSSASHSVKNVASPKVNRLKVKLLYKPSNKNFSKGAKGSVRGAKLKPVVGRTAFTKSCGLCAKQFQSMQNLSTHVASEHMTIDSTPFPCVMCPRNFERRQHCVSHFVHEHCLNVNGKTVGKRFCCKMCNVFFPNKACHRRHLSEVHADVCEACSVCSAVFLTKLALKRHVFYMHSAKHSNTCEVQLSSGDVLKDQVSSRDSEVQVRNGILNGEVSVPAGQVHNDDLES